MRRTLTLILALAAGAAALAAAAYFTRDRWRPLLAPAEQAREEEHHHDHGPADRVTLTPQARKNLGLEVRPVKVQKEYWKTAQLPGVIIDRPGQSDRGVTAPITGVVSRIHAFPGDTVKPGDTLFDIRLTSELILNTQAELYKAVKESQLQAKVIKRLESAGGAVPEARVLEAQNRLATLEAGVQASRQVLQSWGLSRAQIDAAAEGKFVREVSVVAPPPVGDSLLTGPDASAADGSAYEVQDLKVQLGEQVQSGKVLGTLANHRLLYIEGRAFKGEAGLLARAAENAWPVEAEFAEDDAAAWPGLKQTLTIRHLANAMDRASRTFAFYIPLTNQSRTYRKDDKTFLVWRFRPGQRVRLHVRAEAIRGEPAAGEGAPTGVIVLPAAAVVREGPEAYVFRANGDDFDRKPVTVLYEDRREVVLANDGSLAPGVYVAQNAAAALNRVLAAQKAGPAGHGHGHGHDHAGHSH